MARRSKTEDGVLLAAQLIGLLILLGLFFPPLRAALRGFTAMLIAIGFVALAGLIGLILYRLVRGHRNTTQSKAAFTQIEDLDAGADSPSPTGLIEQLRSMDWFQFEKLVAALYRKTGYAVTRRGGANPDGGIDLVIEREGVRSAVQCKQWKTWNVGVRTVRELIGALTDARITRGVLVTLHGCTAEARQLADRHGIEVMNETALRELIDATGSRFDPEILDLLNDTRKYCPKCENEMVLRTATRGVGAGQQFWGCSAYPKCHFTMSEQSAH